MERRYTNEIIIKEESLGDYDIIISDIKNLLLKYNDVLKDDDVIDRDGNTIYVERKIWETDEEMQKRIEKTKKQKIVIAYHEDDEYKHYLKLKEKYEKTN